MLKKVKPGRTLYIATNEKKLSLFEPLSSVYKVRFLQNFSQFWEKGSAWWNWRKEHLKSDSIEPYFDGAMKVGSKVLPFFFNKAFKSPFIPSLPGNG